MAGENNAGLGASVREAQATVQLVSTLTCPTCGGASQETMPTDACQYFYDCRHCDAVLRPLPGHCCVFCSFGDVPCPPVQMESEFGSGSGCCQGTSG